MKVLFLFLLVSFYSLQAMVASPQGIPQSKEQEVTRDEEGDFTQLEEPYKKHWEQDQEKN